MTSLNCAAILVSLADAVIVTDETGQIVATDRGKPVKLFTIMKALHAKMEII